MTNQEIESIQQRLNAATPGPWKAIKYYKNQLANGAGPDWGLEGVRSFEDADLCAHAPTDLRALLAEVERLNSKVKNLEDSFAVIERRLRVDAAPIVPLINEHGGNVEKKAWESVYSCAILAQMVAFDAKVEANAKVEE